MTIMRRDWISIALFLIFGLLSWWLYSTFGDVGKTLAALCALPPVIYYLAFSPKDQPVNK